jgi:hypothetical protein
MAGSRMEDYIVCPGPCYNSYTTRGLAALRWRYTTIRDNLATTSKEGDPWTVQRRPRSGARSRIRPLG